MFNLKKPCKNCPFRRGVGEQFGLRKERLVEIMNAPAFQCHKTVDYDAFEDPEGRQGDRPQQCAGLMSLLWAAERPNTIMQMAIRTGHLNPTSLDRTAAYQSVSEAFEAHGHCVSEDVLDFRAALPVGNEDFEV